MSNMNEKKSIEKSEDIKVKKISKTQRIGLIIVFISLLLIVYLAFLGMSNRGVSHIDKESAIKVIQKIYGTTWYLDDEGETFPLSIRDNNFEKIKIANDYDRERLRVPFYLYLDEEEESLGRQLALIYYDEENTAFKAKFPNSEIYDFSYSISKDKKLESLTFISDINERSYFIKDSNE